MLGRKRNKVVPILTSLFDGDKVRVLERVELGQKGAFFDARSCTWSKPRAAGCWNRVRMRNDVGIRGDWISRLNQCEWV